MLSGQARILDFDASVTSQTALKSRFKPLVVDLRSIGPSARLWVNNDLGKQLRSVISSGPKNSLTFLGSGDYHHISSYLIEAFCEPLSVIVFDHHPDWDILPPLAGCGSWVTRILGMPHVKKVILIGINSDDISTFNIQTGNLASLKNDKVKVYVFDHGPSDVFFRFVPENSSVDSEKRKVSTRIHWQGVKGKCPEEFMKAVISCIETESVYISIDKDCLTREYALTNWEEGSLALEDLLKMLKVAKTSFDIAGMDITGEYSRVDIKGKFKSICSRLDHPRDFSAKGKPFSVINSVNEATNIRILELFLR